MGKQLDKIKVSAGEDLLAFIPHMVGYWPEESIVAIGMAGKQLRATMRLDLPPENARARETERFATIAATQLANDTGSDGCLIAIFGRHDWTGPKSMPHKVLFKQMRRAFEKHGIPVRDAWFVGTEHWRSLECANAECCPWPGKANSSIKESFVNAELIYRGSLVGEAPGQQVQDLTNVRDPEFVARVAAVRQGIEPRLTLNGLGMGQLALTLQAWQFSLEAWPREPDAHMCAFLLAGLGERNVRDAVIVLLASSLEFALLGAAATGLPEPDTEDLVVPMAWHGGSQAAGREIQMPAPTEHDVEEAGHFFLHILTGGTEPHVAGGEPRMIDWERIDRAEPFLQFLARASDTPDKAPVLCILGWIQWCKGRGSWAGHYLQACMEHDPGYRLAELLGQLLSAGHIAECAKNPKTAWHRSPADDEAGGKPDGEEAA